MLFADMTARLDGRCMQVDYRVAAGFQVRLQILEVKADFVVVP